MSGLPWPSEVIELINGPLHAALNSPLAMNWVLPFFAWFGLALMLAACVAFAWAGWAVQMAPFRAAKLHEQMQRKAEADHLRRSAFSQGNEK